MYEERREAWQQYLKKAKRRIRSRRKVLNVVELKYKLMQSHLMPQFHHHLLRILFTVHFSIRSVYLPYHHHHFFFSSSFSPSFSFFSNKFLLVFHSLYNICVASLVLVCAMIQFCIGMNSWGNRKYILMSNLN